MVVRWISRYNKNSPSNVFCVIRAVCGPLFFAATVGLASTTQTIEGIRLPLQRHANGRAHILLTANRAQISGQSGEVEGGIRLFILSENGETNGMARAERGVFNMNEDARTADCLGPVFFETEGIRLHGTNLHWSADANIIRIETNAVLELDRGGKSMVEGMGI